MNRFLDFRAEQEQKLHSDEHATMGKLISLNLTKVEGGVQINVVPDKMAACTYAVCYLVGYKIVSMLYSCVCVFVIYRF